ncbi:hypothetical protein H0H92_001020 [Tricholoma furcatifolium]|nr:hypothetical protein H0H92_001020 [Tricholoma furcatifolium]
MFSSPPTSDGAEGRDDEHPIKLPDTKNEFERLLNYFYHQGIDNPADDRDATERYRIDPCAGLIYRYKPTPDWMSLLFIADRYMFTTVRARAIREIESQDHGDYIMDIGKGLDLAMKYDIQKWKISIFKELCRRQDRISLDEANSMGMDNFVLLAGMREELRSLWGNKNGSARNFKFEDSMVQSVVESALQVW